MGKDDTRDLIARLAAKKRQSEQGREGRIAANKVASAPVLKELRAAGINVQWIADLRHMGGDYGAAVPILAKWLPRMTSAAVKEDIVRCLSVSTNNWIAPEFIAEYRRLAGTGPEVADLRDALANGLEIIADEALFAQLAELVQDRSMGSSRRFLALALGKMKDPRAVTVLMSLLDQEDVRPFALESLGRLRATEAHSVVRSYVSSTIPEVAEAARKALARIERG